MSFPFLPKHLRTASRCLASRYPRRRTRRAKLTAYRLRIEDLEARTLPSSGTVPTFGGNAQHTSLYAGPSQDLNQVLWHTPVDLNPQYSGTDLYIHYGAPLVTAGNTVIVPVKTGATDGFEVQAFDGATGGAATIGGTGTPKYTLSTDYTINGLSYNWTPSFAPVLASDGAGGTRLYFAVQAAPSGTSTTRTPHIQTPIASRRPSTALGTTIRMPAASIPRSSSIRRSRRTVQATSFSASAFKAPPRPR